MIQISKMAALKKSIKNGLHEPKLYFTWRDKVNKNFANWRFKSNRNVSIENVACLVKGSEKLKQRPEGENGNVTFSI